MKQLIKSVLSLIIPTLLIVSCSGDIKPKPDSFLRLEYPNPVYKKFEETCAFSFEKNELSIVQQEKNCAFKINYPKLKATIYINYKPVNGDLNKLLKDAQKLTYDHTIKADGIIEQPFVNPENKVYGMFYEVEGNAATNVQFYATDSVKNFVVGSLYFYAKPNYDSILPAAAYVKDDMRRIMESIQWK
ncbi:gliding motility lipoprotein GldD [Flavobacterium sp. I3-2]|uniref:gliding motility lipoprotein GldD n=1 Tax=Flavobacterium sp. I3-2 TaxID=2748319 RepID=UPI0015B35165|nr:gliding motility lipoprotein GldD [Flavobacterium sp. I3-2]